MARLRDYKKEYKDAIDAAQRFWSNYYQEAEKDIQYSVGNQWDPLLEAYLKGQGREALVFNKMRRILKMITGYQRKNRLSLRIDATMGSSEATASLFSAVCLWTMANCGYEIMSDAFEHGALRSGLNLVEISIDYRVDPISGDVMFYRKPYNRFMIDPNTQDKRLKDADYIITRDYLTDQKIQLILPESVSIKKFKPPTGDDSDFPYFRTHQNRMGNELHKYDRMFVRTTNTRTVMIDRATGTMKEWTGTKKRLKQFMNLFDPTEEKISVIKRSTESIELRILVNGECIWYGDDPTGIGDYPFVPIWGFFIPEEKLARDKLQGIIRCMRDPQTEINKRRSKMLDILDSQISSGWIAKESAVKNKQQLYQTGQAQVIWISETETKAINDVIQQARPAEVPAGLFQSIDLFDKDIMEIPGANSEMLGMPENDDIEIAALLAKLRSGNGLTVLQDLFDNYRFSKKDLGDKLVKAFQANYTPQKIMMITGRQPTPEFYDRRFGKYNCMPVEGLLTDTQRQHHFAQIFAMKRAGAPIPWSAVLAAWPLEGKEQLMQALKQEEQRQAAQAQQGQQLQQIQLLLNQSMMRANIAKEVERLTQAEENRTNSVLDRAKTLKELKGLDYQNLNELTKLAALIQTLQMNNLAGPAPAGGTGGGQGAQQLGQQQIPQLPMPARMM